MPVFQYFGTLDDSLAILRDLCDRGLRILPAAAAPVHDSVTAELADILRATPSFYLGTDFTRFPFQILEATVARLETVDGQPTLIPGDVSYLPKYRNPTTGQLEPAGKDLLSAYMLASLTIRNRCTRASHEIFVARGALGLIQARKAVLAGQ